MGIVVILVVVLLCLAAWVLWKIFIGVGLAIFDLTAAPFPTEGMKSVKQSRVSIERRAFKAMQDARAYPNSKPDRKVGGINEDSLSPSPVIKEDGLSKALRESATRKVKENSPSPLPVALDSENDTAAQKGWLFPEGMTTQYRSNPRFTWKTSDTCEEVCENEKMWLLRL